MATDYTTVALIASTKRRGFVPAGSGTTTAEFLQILTEEMRTPLPAFLKDLREEYLIAFIDFPNTTGIIPAPVRAIGAAFRQIQSIDTSGKPQPLDRIEPENVSLYSASSANPQGFVFQGNNVVLVPNSTSGNFRLSYQQRPGQLVLPEACGKITAINLGDQTITVASRPSTFTNAAFYDFIPGRPNFSPYGMDFGDVNVWGVASEILWSGNVLTYSDPLSFMPQIQVGDYLCLAGETCIAPFPTEIHDLLAQYGAAKVAQSSGSSRAQFVQKGLDDMKADLTSLLKQRSTGNSRPIVHRGSAGMRRGGR